MKKICTKPLLALAIAAFFSTAAQAALINPDGGVNDPTISVGSLDWTAGNLLVTPVGETVVTNPVAGNVIQVYAQAGLSAFVNSSGVGIGGLNLNGGIAATNYEWTYVTAFQETVFDASGPVGAGTATFDVSAGGTNFFQIWYDPTPDQNSLRGTGFNDSVLILEGTVTPFDATTQNGRSSFTASGISTSDPDLDNFNVNNYPAVDSISGTGGGKLAISVASANPAFFLGGVPSVFLLNFDTQLNLAFSQTNPSSCFWNGVALINGVGPNSAGGPCLVNTVGTVNGFNGTNEVLMTDSTASFPTPEPGSLALFGAALSALGFSLRRRRA